MFKEYANFGFDNPNQTNPEVNINDNPLHPVDLEYISKSLKYKMLGTKSTTDKFFEELQWGEGDGALRLTFTPLGGTRAVLQKLIHNLEGTPTWICKKVVEIKNIYDEKPDNLTFLLHDLLMEMDTGNLDAASSDYQGLEHLTLKLAGNLRSRTTQRIFMFEGIRQVKEHEEYIIQFGVTGYGRQRKDQKRLDQFDVFTRYKKDEGTIKICGNELGSSIANYEWQYDVSEFSEYFTPSQKEEDIINAILVSFNCY